MTSPQGLTGAVLTRRNALRLFAAQMAASLAACGKPSEAVVPYVRSPEGLLPGEPLRFATTLPLGGYGQGVIVLSVDGRPIKIEGNPAHPASLGSTNPMLEASVLSLYDPDRSRTILENGQIASWQALRAATARQMEKHRADQGKGLRLLTGRITSPTMQRQIAALLAQNPNATWHVHEPIDDEAEREGARLAYGRPLQALPLLEQAEIVLALDADPLGPGPDQIRNARLWSSRRVRGGEKSFSRVYAAESAPTPTGMKADHRLTAHPDVIANIAIAIANRLSAGLAAPSLSADAERFADAAAQDMIAHPGKALVLAGRAQPPEVHALAHWLSAKLNAPQTLADPIDVISGHDAKSLSELVDELNSDAVETLLILDANPAYDAPPALQVTDAFRKAAFCVHQGPYRDETAMVCGWHVPMSHPLESWSDFRAVDGTASIVQPLIDPLYETVTAHELLALFSGQNRAKAYDLVRDTWRDIWRGTATGDFESRWRTALHDGVIAGSAAEPIAASPPRLPDIKPFGQAAGTTLVLMPDPAVWDGRFANNPWLQECPKPIGKEVWGNALAINPDDASRLKLTDGDVVSLSAADRSIETPVRVHHGVAPGVIAMTLGYGRRTAGAIGDGVGVNAFAMRGPEQSWLIRDIAIKATGARRGILTTQNDVKLDGETRELYPILSLADAPTKTDTQDAPSLLPPYNYDTYAWGMVIDTSVCIGCNACVVACQSENNIPVIGPEEIGRGRDMHWLRVDFYEDTDDATQRAGFQPVPCMHCEQAPCEPVCPVAASVHDGEGLNAQVYNRCVGTRFCEANCPYKVRRFNFFGYADGQEYANLGSETFKAQRNPDVSVRQRGVMEKCTYCVQRISRARRNAEKDERAIGDGEVVTACQSACPTRAISFGDIHNPSSQVSRQKAEPHHYALLGHLDTRPRTTYLADLRNPGGSRP